MQHGKLRARDCAGQRLFEGVPGQLIDDADLGKKLERQGFCNLGLCNLGFCNLRFCNLRSVDA